MLLTLRMIAYVLAVPVATYLGGDFDPATGTLTLNVNTLVDMFVGLIGVVGVFYSSRVAKRNGGLT